MSSLPRKGISTSSQSVRRSPTISYRSCSKHQKDSGHFSVRIVNLSSFGHFSAPNGGINFADTTLPNASGMARYGQSKLANVLHAKTLDKLYGPGSPSAEDGNGEIWTAAVHPGLVQSGLGVQSELRSLMLKIINIHGALGGSIDPDKGSWTSLFCAASPDMKKEQSGSYFRRIAEAGWQSKMAKNILLAQKLEDWTSAEIKQEVWVE